MKRNLNNLCCDKCGKKVTIRTRIKTKEHILKVCSFCASKLKGTTNLKKTPLKRTSSLKRSETPLKSNKKHKDNLNHYFEKMRAKSKGKQCENECGTIIHNPTRANIAHIIAKSTNPEIACNPNNFLLLCIDCHAQFDYSYTSRKKYTKTAYNKAVQKARKMYDQGLIKNINPEVKDLLGVINN